MKRLAPTLTLAAALGACATQPADFSADMRAAPGRVYEAAHRALSAPQVSGVSDPSPLAGDARALPQLQAIAAEPRGPNSLWRAGATSFFNDQRAKEVGDILTVNIEIADKAELSNSSNRQRTGSTSVGAPNLLGLENIPGQILPGGYDPATLISANAQSAHGGQGTINREEKIELTVAAVIVDRLANGNLVIAGRQEVRINAELRELTVSGVIRPEDIGADNTIRNDQIAEARISYGGRGQLSAVQRPNWGQRIADAVTPW
jgi:flagellar L-ring protein precursor FlgH